MRAPLRDRFGFNFLDPFAAFLIDWERLRIFGEEEFRAHQYHGFQEWVDLAVILRRMFIGPSSLARTIAQKAGIRLLVPYYRFTDFRAGSDLSVGEHSSAVNYEDAPQVYKNWAITERPVEGAVKIYVPLDVFLNAPKARFQGLGISRLHAIKVLANKYGGAHSDALNQILQGAIISPDSKDPLDRLILSDEQIMIGRYPISLHILADTIRPLYYAGGPLRDYIASTGYLDQH